MNLYDKIEQLYKTQLESQNIQNIDNMVLKEIVEELREIKQILFKNQQTTKKVDRALMDFVREFRKK